jgi:hypothetical protein
LAYSFGGSSSWSVDPLFGARGLAAPVWQKQKKERGETRVPQPLGGTLPVTSLTPDWPHLLKSLPSLNSATGQGIKPLTNGPLRDILDPNYSSHKEKKKLF